MEQLQTYTPIRRFFKLMQPDRKDIYYIYLYSILSGFITLSLPLGIQAIIGLIAGGNISSSWGVLIFIVTIGILLGGLVKIMQLVVSETLQRRIFARAAFDFAYRLPRFSIEDTRKIHLPEMVNRFFDTLTIQKGLPKILIDLTEAFLQILFGILVLVFYNSVFVVFGIFLLIILALIFYFTGPKGMESSLKESKYKYAVVHWLEEIGRTIGIFKLGGNSELPLSKTDDLVVNYLDTRKKHFKILTIQYGSLIVFKTLITMILLIVGSLLVIENQINLGQFVASEIIVLQILNSVEKLIISMDTVYDVLTSLEKVGQVTDMPIEKSEGVDFMQCDTGQGMSVQLRNITYQFPDASYPVLKNINIDIKAGESVCIAGYNGSGKSTLIKIIAGLYQHYQGQVSYNEIPYGSYNATTLRAKISDLSNKEDIFQGSVFENISLAQPNISYQDVINAAKAVNVHEDIQKLPKGYQTELLPYGRTLSRSVRTKIVLARSIAEQPALFAIEDVMDVLEPHDRHNIIDRLTDKSMPYSLAIVSDDAYLASRCDKIIILDKGEIVAEGTFEQIKDATHFDKIFK